MTLRLAKFFELPVDRDAPVGFHAYDGSACTHRDAMGIVEVRTPRAVR
jgi:hypothetical protein